MKKRLLTATLMVTMALTLGACGFGKSNADDNSETSQATETESLAQTESSEPSTETLATEVLGTETLETESTESTETTEADTEKDTEKETEKSSEKTSEKTSEKSSEKTSEKSSEKTSEKSSEKTSEKKSEENKVTTDPDGDEILGTGTEDDPYVKIPNGQTMKAKTIKIGADKSVYYSIRGAANKWFTIEDENAYVVYEGKKYTAKNGKVSFKVESEKLLAADYVLFKIGNTGSKSKSFTIKLTDEKGTYMNPEKISKTGKYSVSIAEGNSEGYYYKFKATKKGTLRFYINKSSEDAGLSVTNNSTMAQRTFEGDLQTDEDGKEYIEIEVSKGDEIVIVACADRKRSGYPAVDITWTMKYK